MAPKKKAVTPEGHTDRESDGYSLQVTPPGVETITTVIGQVRERRTQIRQDIRRDFTNDVSQFKTRINQHYEAQKTKRMEMAQQQIRRLSDAIEKKASCEDKILKMIAMMANETDKLHSIMECVLNARQQLVLEAASSDKYKEKKR